jgi:branched-chain amino acid transport system permease protein
MQELLQQIINGISLGSIYALIAVGYTMVYGVLQLINFAHGDVFMVGAIVSFYVAGHRLPRTLPWWFHVIVIAGLLVAATVKLLSTRSGKLTLRAMLPFVLMYIALVPANWLASEISQRLPDTSWLTAGMSLLVAIVACGALGFTIERSAYKPLRNRPRINSLITAIGVSLLLEYGGQNPAVFGPTPRAYPAEMVPGIDRGIQLIGGAHPIAINRVDVVVLALTLLFMGVLMFIVLKTKTGLALRAVSYRFDTAALMGVNIDRIISFTFVLGSCLAAVAGVLYAVKYPNVEPLMGLLPGIKAFVAAVFGGIGNIAGAVAGGLILGLVEVLVVGYLPGGSQYRDAAAFVILIVILLVKPSGLLGKNAVEKV